MKEIVHVDGEAMELNKQCVDLLFDCPRNRQAHACPFRQVREQDVVERVNWLKRKNLAELRQLVASHNECRSETGRLATE